MVPAGAGRKPRASSFEWLRSRGSAIAAIAGAESFARCGENASLCVVSYFLRGVRRSANVKDSVTFGNMTERATVGVQIRRRSFLFDQGRSKQPYAFSSRSRVFNVCTGMIHRRMIDERRASRQVSDPAIQQSDNPSCR